MAMAYVKDDLFRIYIKGKGLLRCCFPSKTGGWQLWRNPPAQRAVGCVEGTIISVLSLREESVSATVGRSRRSLSSLWILPRPSAMAWSNF